MVWKEDKGIIKKPERTRFAVWNCASRWGEARLTFAGQARQGRTICVKRIVAGGRQRGASGEPARRGGLDREISTNSWEWPHPSGSDGVHLTRV